MSPGYAQQLYSSARLLTGVLSGRPQGLGSLVRPAGSAAGGGAPEPGGSPLRVADVGCGSGTSTQALVRALTETGAPFEIEGIDGSAGMLAQARTKSWPGSPEASVRFRHAQAQDLVADEPRYDAIFAAYLVRNVPDKDSFLATARRLLAPGGVLVVHDYGVAGRPLDTLAWTALSWGVIIPSAWVVTRRPQLFSYLWRSVLEFDSDEQLRGRLIDAGFRDVGQRPVPGWQRGMVRATWGVV
nr:class I SAM-dependent methyltransferase [Kineosphaera limosa]